MVSTILDLVVTVTSKKVTQIYFSNLLKVPADKPPPGPPWRERGPSTGNLASLSKPHLSGSLIMTNTFRMMANFPQKGGHQYKKLKCLKKGHQTLYLEINTRFPIRQKLLQ
jgi:hypothetical protein